MTPTWQLQTFNISTLYQLISTWSWSWSNTICRRAGRWSYRWRPRRCRAVLPWCSWSAQQSPPFPISFAKLSKYIQLYLSFTLKFKLCYAKQWFLGVPTVGIWGFFAQLFLCFNFLPEVLHLLGFSLGTSAHFARACISFNLFSFGETFSSCFRLIRVCLFGVACISFNLFTLVKQFLLVFV